MVLTGLRKMLFTHLKTKQSEEKNIFYKKMKSKFFSKATFFYFHFFLIWNLAPIRVDFAHNFFISKYVVLFGKYVI